MSTTSSFQSNADGTRITTYTWAETRANRWASVQISHGLAEHGERYDRFARALNAAGFIVHAVDHRGHGRTAGDNLGDFGSAGFSGLIADVAQFRRTAARAAWAAARSSVRPPMGSFAQAAIIDHSSTWSPASSCQVPPPSTCLPPPWPMRLLMPRRARGLQRRL